MFSQITHQYEEVPVFNDYCTECSEMKKKNYLINHCKCQGKSEFIVTIVTKIIHY